MAKLCPLKVLAPKWHLAYFGPNVGHFGHIFELRTSNLFCPSFGSVLVGKPIFRLNGHILDILGPKTLKNSQKWQYLKMRFLNNLHYILLNYSMGF